MSVHAILTLPSSFITKQEPSLCATQYLPDIVKLQQFLYDTFHRRLEKHKAETLTIRDFLKAIKNGKKLTIFEKCYSFNIIRTCDGSTGGSCECFLHRMIIVNCFDHSDNTRNECRELIDSLKKAWALVGQKLAHHSKYMEN